MDVCNILRKFHKLINHENYFTITVERLSCLTQLMHLCRNAFSLCPCNLGSLDFYVAAEISISIRSNRCLLNCFTELNEKENLFSDIQLIPATNASHVYKKPIVF